MLQGDRVLCIHTFIIISMANWAFYSTPPTIHIPLVLARHSAQEETTTTTAFCELNEVRSKDVCASCKIQSLAVASTSSPSPSHPYPSSSYPPGSLQKIHVVVKKTWLEEDIACTHRCCCLAGIKINCACFINSGSVRLRVASQRRLVYFRKWAFVRFINPWNFYINSEGPPPLRWFRGAGVGWDVYSLQMTLRIVARGNYKEL